MEEADKGRNRREIEVCGAKKGKVNSREEITSVFNQWGTNEDSESNKQLVLKMLSCKTQ